MGSINKNDFIHRCCEKCDDNLTKAQMRSAYDTIMDTARECIMAQEDVTFHGLGTLKAFVKEEHTARNPTDGSEVTVPTRLMAKFAINTNFKLALREVDLNPKGSKSGRRR